MFKKKEKKENIFEPEVVIPNKKEIKKSEKSKKNKKSKKDIEFIDEFIILKNSNKIDLKEDKRDFSLDEYHFIDKDPNTECSSEYSDDYNIQMKPVIVDNDFTEEPKRKREIFSDDEVNESSIQENDEMKEPQNKKDIDKYFAKSKKKNKKLLKDPIKHKKISKRQQIRDLSFLDLKDQKVFRFRNKKYYKVEDFIKYLDDNFLEIDKIAKEVMKDENFHGWVSKKSGVFDDSIKQFKEIKDKIGKI